MRKFEQHSRVERRIPVAHAEAFQLMLYKSKDGSKRAWFWNSRDGVTPFGTTVDGVEMTHAINAYAPTYWGMLPAEAEYVWVDYDRQAWAEMARKQYERHKEGPMADAFMHRYPAPEDWVNALAFEHGQPRQLTAAEFLETTSSWMGKPEKAGG